MLDTKRLTKLIDEYASLTSEEKKNEIVVRHYRDEINREIRQIEMKYPGMENQVRKAKMFIPF